MKNFFQSLITEIKTSVFPRNLFFYGLCYYLVSLIIPIIIRFYMSTFEANFLMYGGEGMIAITVMVLTLTILSETYYYLLRRDNATQKSLHRKVLLVLFLLYAAYQYIIAISDLNTPFVIFFFIITLYTWNLLCKNTSTLWFNRIMAILVVITIFIIPMYAESYQLQHARRLLFTNYMNAIENQITEIIKPDFSHNIIWNMSYANTQTLDNMYFQENFPTPQYLFGGIENVSYGKTTNGKLSFCLPSSVLQSTVPLPADVEQCILIKQIPRFSYGKISYYPYILLLNK
ncbi:hypothetical protein COB57_04070 [Candidatus Peregrinibacteria bacterium]|nr:MAG: hypothetical protein COB57_04070 [Candidatus Peregrinibacteria bacterium]